MMAAVLFSCLVVAAPLFDVHTIPLSVPEARTFIAGADGDDVADLFVLDGSTLKFFDDGLVSAMLPIELPPETTAVDLFDLDNDGFLEVIVLSGKDVVRYALVGESAGQAQTLFRLAAHPPGFHAPPFLHVMCLREDGRVQVAIPEPGGVARYALDGTRLSSPASAAVAAAPSFDAWVVSPSSLAPGDAMEIRFEHAWQPGRIPGTGPETGASPSLSAGPYRLRDVAQASPEQWPWFALSTASPASGERAHLAVQGAETGETHIVVRRRNQAGDADFRLGPVRRYPGLPLWQSGLPPDFNGDGFTDLVLWRTQKPAPTINALSRALSAGSWPVDVSLHVFDPAASSFSPHSAGGLRIQTPIARFFSAAPDVVAHVAMMDFNGDGFDDFGCATSPNSYAVWLWSDEALAKTPAFVYESPEPIVALAFREPLSRDGAAALGLRTATGLVFLRPVGLAQEPAAQEDPVVRARIRYLRGLVEAP